MQTDILASEIVTSTGIVNAQGGSAVGRTRIKGVYIIPQAGAGSVVFKDGSATGSVRMTLNTLASQTAPTYILFPGEGLLVQSGIHLTITTVASVVVFYG
jgi:hypothetical protein